MNCLKWGAVGRVVVWCGLGLLAGIGRNSGWAQGVGAHGLVMVEDGVHVEVTALRDDVLRVRYWRGEAKPEDASWAVLSGARTSAVKVVASDGGFQTKACGGAGRELSGMVVEREGGGLWGSDGPEQRGGG